METITNEELNNFRSIQYSFQNLSDEELLKQYYLWNINELKIKLSQTDYKAIKYAEGLISEEDYMYIKNDRQIWRKQINEYEKLIKELESK